MTGPDTPPEQPEPDDTGPWDVKHHGHTVLCQECGSLVEVKDVDAYLLSTHLAVCKEMVLLNGDTE